MGGRISQDRTAEAVLRSWVDQIANQLCRAVDGDFRFTVSVDTNDPTIGKLQMLTNLVIDSARRSLADLESQNERLNQSSRLLEDKIEELETLNRLAVDREMRMIELKHEINTLNERLGESPRYEESLTKMIEG